MGGMRVAYRVLGRSLKGKRPLGRPKRRLKESIKMHLQEIGWKSMDRIHLTQDRDKWLAVMNVAMNHQVSQNAWNFLTSCEMTSFSWWTALLYRVCLSGNQCSGVLTIFYAFRMFCMLATCLLLFTLLGMIP